MSDVGRDRSSITRRDALRAAGLAGLASLAGCLDGLDPRASDDGRETHPLETSVPAPEAVDAGAVPEYAAWWQDVERIRTDDDLPAMAANQLERDLLARYDPLDLSIDDIDAHTRIGSLRVNVVDRLPVGRGVGSTLCVVADGTFDVEAVAASIEDLGWGRGPPRAEYETFGENEDRWALRDGRLVYGLSRVVDAVVGLLDGDDVTTARYAETDDPYARVIEHLESTTSLYARAHEVASEPEPETGTFPGQVGAGAGYELGSSATLRLARTFEREADAEGADVDAWLEGGLEWLEDTDVEVSGRTVVVTGEEPTIEEGIPLRSYALYV